VLFQGKAFDRLVCGLKSQTGRGNGGAGGASGVVAAVMHACISTRCQAAVRGCDNDGCVDRNVRVRIRGQDCGQWVLVSGSETVGVAMCRTLIMLRRLRRMLMRKPAMQHCRRRESLDGNRQHQQIQGYGLQKACHANPFVRPKPK
jgi:hypothetical protein